MSRWLGKCKLSAGNNSWNSRDVSAIVRICEEKYRFEGIVRIVSPKADSKMLKNPRKNNK